LGATPGFIRLVGTVQNRGHMKTTHAWDLRDGSPQWGSRIQGQSPGRRSGGQSPPEADAVLIILYTISVPNCDAYCLLQTITFVQTYKYNFHITVTILSVET